MEQLVWRDAEVHLTDAILPTGPGASGKTCLNAKIALDNGFIHVQVPGEDDITVAPAATLAYAFYKA